MENALTGTGTARFHSERRHFGESRLKKTVSISPPSGRAEAFRQGSDGFSRYRDASGCVIFFAATRVVPCQLMLSPLDGVRAFFIIKTYFHN